MKKKLKADIPPAFLDEPLSEAVDDWGISDDASSSTSAFLQGDAAEDIDADATGSNQVLPAALGDVVLDRGLSAGAQS